ncbi:eukaryotic translation initiation factor 3 subunit A [Perkinsus chesapeaki]|uniref:Eukaryotic translation initiation factor 3 subunit A n=1 Tax=Perkinsus chesapeaki TaxID=330153 RepID=A0A7J6M0C4_PERCH|nr:eukaryotic translation initiation factor 3 subunit A [Perkinsus chesapeaki]
MSYYIRPEAVLKRADELIEIGEYQAAIDLLGQAAASRRFKYNFTPAVEAIMEKFLRLCVQMKQVKQAKEGLIQYRSITQHTQVQSLEDMLTLFRTLSEERMEKASQSCSVVTGDSSDPITPDSVILASLGQDPTNHAEIEFREAVKDMWETYRTVLETVRTNAKLEGLYYSTAYRALDFVKKQNRRLEAKRLCDLFRSHWTSAKKPSTGIGASQNINPNDPAVVSRVLSLRFACVNTAMEMGMWSLAFSVLEDVHTLISKKKPAPTAVQLLQYFDRLSRVLGSTYLMESTNPRSLADNDTHQAVQRLFHAQAQIKYLYLLRQVLSQRSNDSAVPESQLGAAALPELPSLEATAAQTVMAVLAVPPTSRGFMGSSPSVGERADRLDALLGRDVMPTRESLQDELVENKGISLAPAEVRDLFEVINEAEEKADKESTVDNGLCARIDGMLKGIPEQYSEAYAPSIRRNVVELVVASMAKTPNKSTTYDELSKATSTCGNIADITDLIDRASSKGPIVVKDEQDSTERRMIPVVDDATSSIHFEVLSEKAAVPTAEAEVQTSLKLEDYTQGNKERAELEAARQAAAIKAAQEAAAAEKKRAEESRKKKLMERQEMEARKKDLPRTTAMLESIKKQAKAFGPNHVTNITIDGKARDVQTIADHEIIKIDRQELDDVRRKQLLKERTIRINFRREEAKRVEYTERGIRQKEGPHILTWREHVDINRMKRYQEIKAQRQAALDELIENRKEDKAALKPAMPVVEGWIAQRMAERDEKRAKKIEDARVAWKARMVREKLERAMNKLVAFENQKQEEEKSRERTASASSASASPRKGSTSPSARIISRGAGLGLSTDIAASRNAFKMHGRESSPEPEEGMSWRRPAPAAAAPDSARGFGAPSAGKYVPPSRRGAAAAGGRDADGFTTVRRR